MHLPGFHTRREVFDQVAADAAADLLELFPLRLPHLRVLVEDVPPADPAPWEGRTASLGRSLPGTRETPPRAVLHRLPIQTRCSDRDHLELLIRQVLSEQVGSLLGMAAEDVDPDAWGD